MQRTHDQILKDFFSATAFEKAHNYIKEYQKSDNASFVIYLILRVSCRTAPYDSGINHTKDYNQSLSDHIKTRYPEYQDYTCPDDMDPKQQAYFNDIVIPLLDVVFSENNIAYQGELSLCKAPSTSAAKYCDLLTKLPNHQSQLFINPLFKVIYDRAQQLTNTVKDDSNKQSLLTKLEKILEDALAQLEKAKVTNSGEDAWVLFELYRLNPKNKVFVEYWRRRIVSFDSQVNSKSNGDKKQLSIKDFHTTTENEEYFNAVIIPFLQAAERENKTGDKQPSENQASQKCLNYYLQVLAALPKYKVQPSAKEIYQQTRHCLHSLEIEICLDNLPNVTSILAESYRATDLYKPERRVVEHDFAKAISLYQSIEESHPAVKLYLAQMELLGQGFQVPEQLTLDSELIKQVFLALNDKEENIESMLDTIDDVFERLLSLIEDEVNKTKLILDLADNLNDKNSSTLKAHSLRYYFRALEQGDDGQKEQAFKALTEIDFSVVKIPEDLANSNKHLQINGNNTNQIINNLLLGRMFEQMQALLTSNPTATCEEIETLCRQITNVIESLPNNESKASAVMRLVASYDMQTHDGQIHALSLFHSISSHSAQAAKSVEAIKQVHALEGNVIDDWIVQLKLMQQFDIYAKNQMTTTADQARTVIKELLPTLKQESTKAKFTRRLAETYSSSFVGNDNTIDSSKMLSLLEFYNGIKDLEDCDKYLANFKKQLQLTGETLADLKQSLLIKHGDPTDQSKIGLTACEVGSLDLAMQMLAKISTSDQEYYELVVPLAQACLQKIDDRDKRLLVAQHLETAVRCGNYYASLKLADIEENGTLTGKSNFLEAAKHLANACYVATQADNVQAAGTAINRLRAYYVVRKLTTVADQLAISLLACADYNRAMKINNDFNYQHMQYVYNNHSHDPLVVAIMTAYRSPECIEFNGFVVRDATKGAKEQWQSNTSPDDLINVMEQPNISQQNKTLLLKLLLQHCGQTETKPFVEYYAFLVGLSEKDRGLAATSTLINVIANKEYPPISLLTSHQYCVFKVEEDLSLAIKEVASVIWSYHQGSYEYVIPVLDVPTPTPVDLTVRADSAVAERKYEVNNLAMPVAIAVESDITVAKPKDEVKKDGMPPPRTTCSFCGSSSD